MLPLSSLNSAALLRLVALKLLALLRSPMGLCSEVLMLLVARLTQSMQSIWAVWAVNEGFPLRVRRNCVIGVKNY